ncbi:hypothetical protein ZYZZX_61 [Hafnia phage vB_HpaM_Zyzzx]|uniref:Uncharacterized protein n=1 Tax=Hafnia phage vB_HpaM_Zyzzx TaxID=2836109 RepID=A0AAE8BF80_9CAUD|nr:hypothetical protein ZYZZX_61 [Hafnia phage vB_HpaM_Zyzzx]
MIHNDPIQNETLKPNQEDLKMVSAKTLFNTALQFNNRKTAGLAQILWNLGMVEAVKAKHPLYFSNKTFKVTSQTN